MTAQSKGKERERETRVLYRIISVQFLIMIFIGVGLWRIPRQFTTYTAPDISKAFVQRIGEVPAHAIHDFARALWETVNYCSKDCGEEYPKSLQSYGSYFSARCLSQLQEHYDKNRNLYTFRTRRLLPTDNTFFSPDNVRQVSNDSWLVYIDYNFKEEVYNAPTRDILIRYPLKIIKSSRPLAINPIGLEVDCYFGDGPQRIDSDDSEQSSSREASS
ncbi:DUF2895 family protein [Cardiobacterium hominis]|jgi:hypothetical protein|uniref:DUF2895 family protein n=1 Tax=Cardiobacterium hominis TaxID=2718 RepID=UPI0028E68E0E|nr:DUF2895 family protein [Cardiobacterium hominis]